MPNSRRPSRRRWFQFGVEILLVILPIPWWVIMGEVGVGSDFVQLSTTEKSLVTGGTLLIITSQWYALFCLNGKWKLLKVDALSLVVLLAITRFVLMLFSFLFSLVLLLGVFVAWW
jgi:hypothetical protein